MLSRRTLVRSAVASALALSLIGGGVVAQAALTQTSAEVRAGAYALDPAHGKITWSVKHMGFSTYTGQFVNVSADLTLDPANPSAATLTATVPLTDVAPNNDALKAHLQTPDFFDTAQYPTATFTSTSVTVDPTDPTKAKVAGDLTLHGQTHPVVLDVKFNQAGPFMDGKYRVGFDGETTIDRTQWGIDKYAPALGADVTLHIEGEFVAK